MIYTLVLFPDFVCGGGSDADFEDKNWNKQIHRELEQNILNIYFGLIYLGLHDGSLSVSSNLWHFKKSFNFSFFRPQICSVEFNIAGKKLYPKLWFIPVKIFYAYTIQIIITL